MKKLTIKILFVIALIVGAVFGSLNNLSASIPDQEQAFIEAYKKAFESKDEATQNPFSLPRESIPWH